MWLVGTGQMALCYTSVLERLDRTPVVFGRSELSARVFREETGLPVLLRPLAEYSGKGAEHAIVCVSLDQLSSVTESLIRKGVPQILVEKPAAMRGDELCELRDLAATHGCTLYVGYNRRHLAAVEKAREIIETDGGVTSFSMELTEWSHVIGGLDKTSEELSKWFLANTTHVVDLAWHLCGRPQEMEAFVAGELDWHQHARFAGVGKSVKDALFSYNGDWDSAGRWALEINTVVRRLIFSPLEMLQTQTKGSVAIEQIELDDDLDQTFKPGLYRQVERFLAGDDCYLCSIDEHIENWPWFEKMAGYTPSL